MSWQRPPEPKPQDGQQAAGEPAPNVEQRLKQLEDWQAAMAERLRVIDVQIKVMLRDGDDAQ